MYDDENFDNNEDSRNTNDHNNYDSEEDTEEASETEFGSQYKHHNEPMEIKEQMYQDKLANLKKQLENLKDGIHSEYMKKVKKLEQQYKERIILNDINREYLIERVEREYIIEKEAAVKEFDEKKADLKENLLTDFEDRKKMIESERHNMELTNDSMEIKPTVTRKLRRRPNDPIPVVEKRRKPATGQLLTYLLDEKDIENDIKLINRVINTNGIAFHQNINVSSETPPPLVETKIEDGKLLYERRWFHRGQSVYIEGKDMPRFAATISAIGNEAVWVKKADNNKVKLNLAQLSKGKVAIKRRAN